MKYINSRDTKQMALILDIIGKTDSHPSANEIFMEAQKVMPSISLGTVYRNIDKLVKTKKILKFAAGENKYRYDCLKERHDHIRCILCGKVKDLKNISKETIKKQIQKESNFSDFKVALEITGICVECASNGKRGDKHEA